MDETKLIFIPNYAESGEEIISQAKKEIASKFEIIDGQDENMQFTDFKLVRRKSKSEKAVNGLRLADIDIGYGWRYTPIDEPEELYENYKERIQTILRKALYALRYVRINQCFFAKDLVIGIELTRHSTRVRIDYGILLRALMRENESLREHFIEDGLVSNQIVYKRIK